MTRLRQPTIQQEPLLASEKRLLGLLFRRGALTQNQLADLTGLTQQSVSRLASNLIGRGCVLEGEKRPSGKRGYPSASLVLAPEYAVSAGLALLGDVVALTICDFAGNVLETQTTPMIAVTQDAVLGWLDDALPGAMQRVAHARPLIGLGVGIAGSFIGDQPGFNTPFYLNDWAGVDIEAIFAGRYGLTVLADNNGNTAALAEAMTGVGKWADSFAYLTISAGVGGGVILNGELWRGRHGNAGEFAGGLPSNIYPFPNLELLRRLVVRDGLHEFQTVTEMVEYYDPNWPAIDEWIARVRDSFSIIASNATAILDLDAVVFGGQMPRDLAERVIAVIELYDQKRRAVPRPMARLVPAEAEGNATALGAAILPLQKAYFSHP
ncbi:MAG: hypothetical protein RLZZ385_2832 [Pseudomonadota bacterium]